MPSKTSSNRRRPSAESVGSVMCPKFIRKVDQIAAVRCTHGTFAPDYDDRLVGGTGRMARQSNRHGAVGAVTRIVVAIALACGSGRFAAAADSLYRAQAIVTGQGEANRIIGFASSLEDVLIKVSGALKLAADVSLEPYKPT